MITFAVIIYTAIRIYVENKSNSNKKLIPVSKLTIGTYNNVFQIFYLRTIIMYIGT